MSHDLRLGNNLVLALRQCGRQELSPDRRINLIIPKTIPIDEPGLHALRSLAQRHT